MSNILNEIVDHKRREVEERKSLYPVKLLEKSIYFHSPTVSLKRYLLRKDKSGIIAEIKRRSPSKGIINKNVSIEKVSIGYMQAGASALSILTDEKFFGGSAKDLSLARKFNFCPILRKDFIVDEYQIFEAKSIGADAVLLISSILRDQELKQLSDQARSLEMEVLLEVHKEDEIPSNLEDLTDLVGVNNRDLTSFEVDIDTSRRIAAILPESVVKVSESGISDPKVILELRQMGFKGFLIGETFMQVSQPEKACRSFVEKLKSLEKETEHENKDLWVE